MVRRALVSAAILAVLACTKAPSEKGPYVARGDGITVTAKELKTRLDEQSPMIRGSFQSLDRKKQFLDSYLKFEVLARAAEKEGLANDPDVRFTMKKVMVSKYYQKHFQDQQDPLKAIPEADVRKYYDEHGDEFHRPARVHAVHIFLEADAASPERAGKLAEARKILAEVLQDEKKNDATALTRIARTKSDDLATKGLGGDLGFRSQDEYEKAYGKEVSEAIFKLKDNQTAPEVIATPQGFHLVRVLGRQPEFNRTFEEARAQIALKLNGQRKSKQFEDLVKKLVDDAHIKIFDSELEKVSVASGPGPGPGRPMGHVTGPQGPGPAQPAPMPPGHPTVPAPR